MKKSHFTEEERARIIAQVEHEISEDNEHAERAPAAFLAAWKQGIRIAGEHYFHIDAEYLDAATRKTQLRPRAEIIAASASAMSAREAAFLGALCSFYSVELGQKLMTQAGCHSIRDLAAALNIPRRRILARLFMNYRGW